MRKFLTLIAFGLTFNLLGQVPTFSSNVPVNYRNPQPFYEQFKGKYDFVMGFTQKSIWGNGQAYDFLTFDGKYWKLKRFSYQLNKKGKATKKRSRTIRKITEESIHELLNFFSESKFFNLDTDSLSLNFKIGENGINTSMSIDDGTSDIFEVFNDTNHKVIGVYCADSFQKFVFTQDRQNFIECRDKFLKLTKEKKADNNR